MHIHDDRFLRELARRFCGRSRVLTGATLDVVDHGSDVAGLEIRISGRLFIVVAIAWVNKRAWLLPGSTLLRADDLADLDEAFTDHVGRFLRKHHFIDANGRSMRRSIA
jgi:hypothetical protein